MCIQLRCKWFVITLFKTGNTYWFLSRWTRRADKLALQEVEQQTPER